MTALFLPCSCTFSAQSSELDSIASNSWRNSIEIYAQALNIRGDSKVKDLAPKSVDIDPEFIMDHIDMGAMLRWESIYENKWGFYLDYSYMKLSGETDSLLQTDLSTIRAEMELRQGVLEAKGFKRYTYDFGTVDYMAGIRWWDNDVETKIRSTNNIGPSINKGNNPSVDWVDYLIGARLTTKLNEDWSTYLSGDIGFSRDTSFTSAVQAGFRYHLNTWSDFNLSYKSTWVDFDNGDTFAYNTATQGFLVGWAAYF